MKKLPRGDAMDDYLATLGLCRKPTAKDGSCLFRAVSEQLFGAQSYHLRVRQACIEFLEKNKFEFSQFVDGPFDHYLYRLQNSKEWAGQVEISALSLMYKHDFIVYQDIRRPPVNVSQNGYKEKIYLCFSDGNHYDSVYPLNYCSSAALCQSILYEILYKNVFKMENPVDQGVEMMSTKSHKTRKDSVSSVSDKADSPTPESPTDSSELDSSTDSNKDGKVDRKSEHHSLPFPYRVAKALDPGIYRNVEYDIWLEGKKEQKREQQWTDCHYTPGDKCQVTLEEQPDKVYHAHIQEITPDKGPVTVFIEELGEKHKVPFSSLKPLPQSYHQGWAMVPGKSYKQLSGYYQKAPITEQDSQNMGKKKNRRKKKKVPTATLR